MRKRVLAVIAALVVAALGYWGYTYYLLAQPDNIINGFKHKRFYAIRSVLHGSLGIAPGGLGFPET